MSFRISLTPYRRAAARFVGDVSRGLQRALAEEEARRGLKQADIARALDVDRATITRQIHGEQNMTLARVAELAWAMGRKAEVTFPEAHTGRVGENVKVDFMQISAQVSTVVVGRPHQSQLSAQVAHLKKGRWQELPQVAE